MPAPGYQRDTYYQPSRVPSGQAEMLGSLSERLQQFGQLAYGAYEERAIPAAELAGTEAAAAGETKLKPGINRVNRAYNEALIRAYALDAYADVHAKLSQFETESGTDVGKFKTAVAGYRSGMLPNMLPAAQPIIAAALQQRELEGVQRIGTLAAAEGQAEAVAASERGLDTLEDQISRLYTEGDPASVAQADALTEMYLAGIEGNVAGGLYTPRQGAAKRDEMLKNVTRHVSIGRMERAIATGHDPVAEIERVMNAASPVLSDEEKMLLVGDMLQRLNVHQALVAEELAQEELALKAGWAAGEKEATQLLLRGRLTVGILDRMVTDDRLDPAIARALRSALKEGGGDAVSDPRRLFNVETNLFDFSEEDIRDAPGISWKDKADLIAKRRQQEGGWRDSNNAQEAAARIDRELGIIPGTFMPSLPEKMLTARGRAHTAWYDSVEALPPDEREARAIEMAESVIQRILRDNNADEVKRLQNERDSFIKEEGDPAKMSRDERVTYEERLKRYEDQIRAAESKAQ
jgi:hypothetical protein